MIWRLFMFKKLLPLLFLFAGFQANAALIDNGDFSTDVESGLDWLDWSLTLDKTQAEALTQFSGAGWRVATAAEAAALISNQFDDGSSVSNGYVIGTPGPSFIAESARFLDLFGGTGLFAGTYATVEGFGLLGFDSVHVFAGYDPLGYGAVDARYTYYSVALVKVAAVSEPAIIALFSLGLVGIGFARRRQS
jgi:hypothetical protein